MQERSLWSLIVVRNNTVEIFKSFNDYFEAENYTYDFISNVDRSFVFPINFNGGEYYSNGEITIGLYHSTLNQDSFVSANP